MPVDNRRPDPGFRRLALAPALIAVVLLIAATLLVASDVYTPFRYLVSILALICLWFAVQGRAWWALPLLAAVAVLWNPVFPIELTGQLWMGLHYVAAAAFLAVGILVKVRMPDANPPSRGGRGR